MDTNSPTPPTENVAALVREGIAAAKVGQRIRARDLLTRAVKLDEQNVSAWMWLSGVVDGLEDREVCLENVLALEPGHQAARRGLEWVRAEIEKRLPTVQEEPASSPPPLYVESESQPEPSVPLGPTGVSSQPELPPQDPWASPLNPFLCPYCASFTQEQDRQCHTCGNSLWISVRRREEPSWWLWVVLVFQMISALFYIVSPLVALTLIAFRLLNSFDPFPFVPLYLGLSGRLSPEVSGAALSMLPRLYLLPFALLAFYSLAMLLGTYLRWKPIFYVLLAGLAVRLAFSVAGIALGGYYGMICGGAGVLFNLGTFFIILQLEDDFFWDSQRIYFGLGRRVRGGVSLIAQGRAYAKQRMWALAALYLRAGIGKVPDQVGGYTSLAMAYMHLKRFDLAEQTLHEARRVAPDHPDVAKLIELLHAQQPTHAQAVDH